MNERFPNDFGYAIASVAGLVALLAANPSLAADYRCGTPDKDHCYAVNTWTQRTEYFGAYADISSASLECNDCDGFVDDEIWLVDSASPQCKPTGDKDPCWVEAGAVALDRNPQFFWADSRPDGSFNLHLVGDYKRDAHYYHYMIIKEGRNEQRDTFDVWIYDDALATLYFGKSTANGMQGRTILIGQELAGTHGAWADAALLTKNIWAVQPLGQDYTFWYVPQTTKGSETINNPPFGGWWTSPVSPPPEGGMFITACCER